MGDLNVGARAPDAQLTDATGHLIRLSDFWWEQPTLLLFLRHFG
jgi:peroxiredoxin